MNVRNLIIAFLLLPVAGFFSVGCDVLTSEFHYGEEFQLPAEKRALVGNEALITFVEVVGDSRCPRPVECVWAGNAEVLFELKRSGYEPKRFSLNTHHQFTRDTTIDGIHISLLNLDPYPESVDPIDPDLYVATITLEK